MSGRIKYTQGGRKPEDGSLWNPEDYKKEEVGSTLNATKKLNWGRGMVFWFDIVQVIGEQEKSGLEGRRGRETCWRGR